jgi:prepilin-type N-terminal cleavage/methylation domain-containing protein
MTISYRSPEEGRGFTLIELLVVVAIVSLLTAIIIASLTSAKNKALDKAIVANMLTIRNQAQLYYEGAGAGVYAPEQTLPLSNNCATGLYTGDTVILDAVARLVLDRGVDYVASNDYFCLDSLNTGKIIDGNSTAAWNGMYGQGSQNGDPTVKTATVDTNTALCNG